MNDSLKNISAIHAGNVLDSMRERRVNHAFKQQKMSHTLIIELLNAAIIGTGQMHQEPWVFVVIQDKEILGRLCQQVKSAAPGIGEGAWHLNQKARCDAAQEDETINMEGNRTLIAICGNSTDQYVVSESWHAARNLMVAASSHGLKPSVFKASVATLNKPEWKNELVIASDIDVFVPIMLSQPHAGSVADKYPEVISWK